MLWARQGRTRGGPGGWRPGRRTTRVQGAWIMGMSFLGPDNPAVNLGHQQVPQVSTAGKSDHPVPQRSHQLKGGVIIHSRTRCASPRAGVARAEPTLSSPGSPQAAPLVPLPVVRTETPKRCGSESGATVQDTRAWLTGLVPEGSTIPGIGGSPSLGGSLP